MNQTWVVVADSSRARIFQAEGVLGPLREVATLTHPEARLHTQELTSDLPGRAFDSVGAGRHAMERIVDPKEHEALMFAHQVATRLETAYNDGQFAQLVLVAAPRFLGQVRQTLSNQVAAAITYELDKNLTQQSAEDIRRHLPERL